MQDEPEQDSSPGSPKSAASYVCGSDGASPHHDEDWPTRANRASAEKERLRDWATREGKLGGQLPPDDLAEANEHRVHFDESSARWIKATRPEVGFGYQLSRDFNLDTNQRFVEVPGKWGGTAGEYLDRLGLHNDLFEDDVTIERVVECGGGALSIVTSQSDVSGRSASQPEIDELMASKGFVRLDEGMYHHGELGLVVYDLVPKNAVFSQGLTLPIDPIIQRVTPEFAEFLKEHAF